MATQSATQPDQWGYFTTRRMTGGEYIGAMLDTHAPTGPSRYLVKLRNGVRDGARCRPGGAKRANDPRGTGLPANALLWVPAISYLACGRSEAQPTPLDGRPVGSVGDPYGVFSSPVGCPMATKAPDMVDIVMKDLQIQ